MLRFENRSKFEELTMPLNSGSTDASTFSGVEQPLDTITDGDNKHKIQRSGQRSIQGNLELGISILQHVEGQLNRADSTAQLTLTLDALLIASSAFLGTGATGDVARISATAFSYRMVAVLGVAMFITLLISTIYALVAVIPRFTPENMANNNIFYFGNIVQQERQDFAEHYFSQSNREIERMLMSEIHDLSGIAKQKFVLIRMSYIFLFASLGFWSIVQMIILLIR
jgi:pycsar effector protein